MSPLESLDGVLPTAPRAPAIEAHGMTRFFGRKCAVDGLSLVVPRGSVSRSSDGTAPVKPPPFE